MNTIPDPHAITPLTHTEIIALETLIGDDHRINVDAMAVSLDLNNDRRVAANYLLHTGVVDAVAHDETHPQGYDYVAYTAKGLERIEATWRDDSAA